MSNEKKGVLKQLRPLWRGIDLVRRVVLNIIFLVVLIFGLNLLLRDTRPDVPGSTALVVAPQGNIVEQLGPMGLATGAKKMVGLVETETLLKELVDAIDMARDDKRVKALLLDLNGMGGAGLTKLQDLKEAVNRFKKSGKTVIATADNYNRNAYYLAAHADEIYMHHMGVLMLDGYSRYKRYYKDGLDRLEVDMNIFRVGKYKSYVEPFMRNTMSEEAREANLRWLGVLWESYLKDVAAARDIKVETLKNYTDQFNTYLKAVDGQTALMALKAGLIDHAATRDQVRDRLIKLVGEDKKTTPSIALGIKITWKRWTGINGAKV
jgi:protease-4